MNKLPFSPHFMLFDQCANNIGVMRLLLTLNCSREKPRSFPLTKRKQKTYNPNPFFILCENPSSIEKVKGRRSILSISFRGLSFPSDEWIPKTLKLCQKNSNKAQFAFIVYFFSKDVWDGRYLECSF